MAKKRLTARRVKRRQTGQMIAVRVSGVERANLKRALDEQLIGSASDALRLGLRHLPLLLSLDAIEVRTVEARRQIAAIHRLLESSATEL